MANRNATAAFDFVGGWRVYRGKWKSLDKNIYKRYHFLMYNDECMCIVILYYLHWKTYSKPSRKHDMNSVPSTTVVPYYMYRTALLSNHEKQGFFFFWQLLFNDRNTIDEGNWKGGGGGVGVGGGFAEEKQHLWASDPWSIALFLLLTMCHALN
jgi:hypothetical protein